MTKKAKAKKEKSNNTGLILTLIDRFDDFKKTTEQSFVDFKEVVIKKLTKHEVILTGEDGRSGMVKDVNDLKNTHTGCNIKEVNEKLNRGVGMLIVIGIVAPLVLGAILSFFFSWKLSQIEKSYAYYPLGYSQQAQAVVKNTKGDGK